MQKQWVNFQKISPSVKNFMVPKVTVRRLGNNNPVGGQGGGGGTRGTYGPNTSQSFSKNQSMGVSTGLSNGTARNYYFFFLGLAGVQTEKFPLGIGRSTAPVIR